jgi:hypothetical protein
MQKGPNAKRPKCKKTTKENKLPTASPTTATTTAYAKACFFVATGFFVIWAKVIYLEYQVP